MDIVGTFDPFRRVRQMMLETAHVVAAPRRLFEEQRAGLSTGAEDGKGQIIGQK